MEQRYDFLAVINRFNEQINSTRDEVAKKKIFMGYISDVLKFLSNDANRNNVSKFASKIYQSFISRAQFITSSDDVLMGTVDILTRLLYFDSSFPQNSNSVLLFVKVCTCAANHKDFLPTIHRYFGKLFMISSFVQNFIKSEGIRSYVEKVLSAEQNYEIIENVNKLILSIPEHFFSSPEFTNAINRFALMGKADRIQPKMRLIASQVLLSFFGHLSKLQHKEVTLTDFDAFDGEFLQGFIVRYPHEYLAEMIQQNRKFIDMTLNVFKQKRSKPYQPFVIRALLEASPYITQKNPIFMIVSDFLTAVPKERNVRPIIDYMTENRTTTFCDILLSGFVKTVEIAEAFIECDGIEWLEDMRIKGLIDMDLYSQILSSLVVLRRFADLDDWIDDLPEDHPIFKLNKQQLDKIVYGMNCAKYRPIRVPSLFHLLDPPEHIDPYNAWMLGNCVVSQYVKKGTDIYDIPFINEIGNRYIKTKHVNLLMARPFELKRFCSTKYPHYPLFQFYQGREELKIADSFKAISFWFMFSDETDQSVTFFRTEGCSIAIEPGRIIVSLENNVHKEVKVEYNKMTHVYLFIEEHFISQTITVRIKPADKDIVEITSEMKEKQFLSTSFSWIGRGLLFLGATIRLFKSPLQYPDRLFQKGPNFIDYIEPQRLENIITPYTFCNPSSNEPNSSDDPRITIPSNFVAVPYFGLPFHFLSMRKISRLFKMLGTAQTVQQYHSLFSTLMSITSITYFNSLKFWPKILSSMKKHKQFISKDLFLKALKSASLHQRREQILGSILFDNEMWQVVDNKILISGLFEYFSNIDWSTIEGFDLFLAKTVINNPKSVEIVDIILHNHEKLQAVIKHLIQIMRIAHVLDDPVVKWENICRAKTTDVQLTIIEGFTNFINENTVKLFTSWLKFEKLKLMMYNATPEAAVKIYHLMTTAAVYLPGYIKLDHAFLIALAKLSNRLEIWRDTFLIATDKADQLNTKGTILPVVLVLVWSMSLYLVHQNSFPQSQKPESIKELFEAFNNGIIILKDRLSNIFTSSLCISVLSSWFPLIFSYTGHLQDLAEHSNSSQFKLCESVSFSQLSEANDSIWQGKEKVIKEIVIPPTPSSPSAYMFMLEKIQSIMLSFGIKYPIQTEFDPVGFSSFIESFELTNLIVEILYKSPPHLFNQLFTSMFCSVPFYDIGRAPIIIQPLMHLFLDSSKSYITSDFQISTFLEFVMFFVCTKCFTDSTTRMITDLFTFFNSLLSVTKSSVIISNASKINMILFDLFMHAPHSKMILIIPLLQKNIHIIGPVINETKTTKAWLYALFVISRSHVDEFTTFIQGFANKVSLDPKDLEIISLINKGEMDPSHFSIIENAWRNLSSFIEKTMKIITNQFNTNKGTFNSEISALSRDVTEQNHRAHSKHYVEAKGFKLSLYVLESTFSLNEEKTHWKLFINSNKDRAADVSNFNPQCYQLSPRCLPYRSPRVLTPSRFPKVDLDTVTSENSSVISLFQHNSKLLFNPAEYSDTTLLELFKRTFTKFGYPSIITSCTIKRYDNAIPCALFIYKDILLFLSFAKVIDGGKNIELMKPESIKVMHSFIESVLLGHWGKTSLFASHIVVEIPTQSIIFVKRYNEFSVAIWAYIAGHFLINIDRTTAYTLIQMAHDSYSLPGAQYTFNLRSAEEAYAQYSAGRMSTQQLILALNSLTSRSFVDLDRIPYFPCVENGKIIQKDVPTRDASLTDLEEMLPFGYFKHNKADTSKYDPTTLTFYVPKEGETFADVVKRVNAIEDAKNIGEWVCNNFFNPTTAAELTKIKVTPRVIISAAFINKFHVSQLIRRSCSDHQTMLFERSIVRKINKLSARIEPTRPNYVRIDKRLMSMTLLNKQTGKVIYMKMDYIMIFADAISISSNGLFIVVDFEFGLTRVYKINFRDNSPVDYTMISDFSWDSVPKSVISGCDWICATACVNRLVFWEFSTCAVHRFVDVDEKIEHISMDEEFGTVWISTDHSLMMYSINGELIASLSIDLITALEALPLPADCKERTAVLGFEDGSVAIATPRLDIKSFEIKYLPSEHTIPVDRIAFHPSLEEFLTIDEEGNCYLWNAEGVTGAVQKFSIFEGCPYCGGEVSAYCNICNRSICSHCMSEANPKTICGMCAARLAYF